MEFKHCISSITELEFVPPVFEEKVRTTHTMLFSNAAATLDAFTESICGTETSAFEPAPEPSKTYTQSLLLEKPNVMHELPDVTVREGSNFVIHDVFPSTQDEEILLKISLNRHYLSYLGVQLALLTIEQNILREHVMKQPPLIATESNRLITSFLRERNVAESEHTFSLDKLKLDDYPA